MDELISQYSRDNLIKAAGAILIQSIAETTEISITDADLEEYMASTVGGGDYSSYEENYGRPYLKQATLYQKVMDTITDSAVLAP